MAEWLVSRFLGTGNVFVLQLERQRDFLFDGIDAENPHAK